MKRMLTRFLMLSLILTVMLSVTGVQKAEARWTMRVGETKTFSGYQSGGDIYYWYNTYVSDSSVLRIVSYSSSGNYYTITVKALAPGKAYFEWYCDYGYYRWDSVLGYYQLIQESCDVFESITVEGCTSHNWSWKTVTPATTCTNGLERRTCSNTGCNETETRTIYATHDYDDGVLTTNPTPESNGVLTYTCEQCGKTKTGTFSKDHAVHLIGEISNYTAKVGETAYVWLYASGDGLKYQWYVKDPGASKFTKSSIKTDEYSVKMTQANTGRQVYCIVTDQYGNQAQTITVTLYSNKMITKQPTDASAYRDDPATVSVEAMGELLNYQWYYKDPGMSKFAALKDQYEATYSCIMGDKNNGRQVYCKVTNIEGHQQKSEVVTLTMLPDKPVYIREQPVGVGRFSGEKAGVKVVATGKDCTYAWYYKDPGMTKFAKSSVTDKYYTITMNSSRENRQVYCIVTDAYGNTVKSDTVKLTMKRAAKITTQPKNVAANYNQKATVTVKATGDGIKYAWYVKDAGSEEFVKSSIKTSSYSVTMNKSRDGRQVYCVITDKYGNSVTTKTVTMTMKNKITITQQPQSVTAVNNEPVSITVQATGEGLKYQWYYKDPGMSKFAKASIKTANYAVTMNEKRDGRQLYCKITDKYGLTVNTDTVTLTFNDKPIVITQQPKDTEYVGVGETVTATVKAEGAGLTYKWYYKNRDADKFSGSNQKTDTYTLTMSTEKSHREVYCKITDQYGNSIKTDTVTLKGAGVIEFIKLYGATESSGKLYSYSYADPDEIYVRQEREYLLPKAEGHELEYSWRIINYGILSIGHDIYGTYLTGSNGYSRVEGYAILTITDSAGTTLEKTFEVW